MLGLSKPEPKNSNGRYSENKILNSNDVEPNPGPNAQKKKTYRSMFSMAIIMIIILIISKMKTELKTKGVQQHSSNIISQLLRFISKRNTTRFTFQKSTSQHMILLLILAGDVQLNPGQPGNHTCLKCDQISNPENGVICDTCKNWCHINCSSDKVTTLESNFQWICPNQNCSPNHHPGKSSDVESSPNRYQTLTIKQKGESRKKPQNVRKQKNINPKCRETQKDKKDDLWDELTKISPNDYIGKDKCKGCYKTIKANQKAILCDSCDRWIHQKCSDMNEKNYNRNRNRKFTWNCNKCRDEEILITDLPQITTLNDSQMPKLPEDISSERNKHELIILHMNCRSIVNKEEDLIHICNETQADIVCLTETWMDDSVPVKSHIPPGYRVIRKDRSDVYKQKYGKSNGGGVAIYYKENLKIETKHNLSDKCEEILWVHIKSKPDILLGVIYRAEYTDILIENENDESTTFEENIKKVSSLSKDILLIGDLNCDITANVPDKQTETLTEICQTYGLEQLISKPTRFNPSTKKHTTIDHVWTDNKNCVKETGTFVGLSDHFGIYSKIKTNPSVEGNISQIKRDFKKYKAEDFVADLDKNLKATNLEELISNSKLNEATNLLIKTISDSANKHAPFRERRKRMRKQIPWFTEELVGMISEKKTLLKDYYYYGYQTFYHKAQRLKNKINHLKRKLQKSYYTTKISESEGDSKKLWGVLKDVTKTTKSKDAVEPENMTKEKANFCNHFFATIGVKIQETLQIKEHTNNFKHLKGFKFHEETEESISKLIDRIRSDVATGTDDLNITFIKDSKYVITPYLTKLVNLSYKLTQFPEAMKRTRIKALHKKESTEEISNYRPISILPVLSKVFERSGTNQMVKFLEENMLINTNQHAYRKGHSTTTCLVEIINYIYKLLDKKKIAGIASLDLSKAYDSISHTLLLHKLSKMGFSEDSLLWIKSYLHNRKQIIRFKNVTSDEETVMSGIPQGSILGPVLFICFTNDLPEAFPDGSCKLVSYADDCQLTVEGETLQQVKKKLENVIVHAQKWYEENSMKNNIGKTEILIVNPRKQKHNITVQIRNDSKPVTIIPSKTIKVLGIHLDQRLNWSRQITEVRKKATNAVRNLHRINSLIPVKQRIQLYNSLVVPHFSYGENVWGGCGATISKRLQTTQNYAVKSILGMKKYDSATEALTKLQLLNLAQRRKVHEAVFTYKAINGEQPRNICESYVQQRSTRNTRAAQANKLNLPKHTTTKYQQSPYYRTITTWNALPAHLVYSTPNQLKTAFQRHLIKETYGTH